MKIIKIFSNSIASTLMGSLILSTAASAVDFTIQLQSVRVSGSRSAGKLTYTALIKNLDTDAFNGDVRIKAILIPSNDDSSGRVQQKGVVLPSKDVRISLQAGASQVISVSEALPKVPSDNYLLGAIVNSNRAVEESNIDNDLSADLLAVGRVSNNVAGPETQAHDCYSDTENFQVDNTVSGATHSWRLFCRGSAENLGLFALFMIADLKAKKLYMSDYEKGVGWINMGTDVDAQGRDVPYDVYWQSPTYKDLKAGKYYLLSLVNARDALREVDHSNNLDLRKFEISPAYFVNKDEDWYNFDAGAAVPQTRLVNFVTDFSEQARIEINPSSIPSCMSLKDKVGDFSEGKFTTEATVNCGRLPLGHHEFQIQAKATLNGREEHLVLPIVVNVFSSSDKPSVQITDHLDLTAVKPGLSGAKWLGLKNSGNGDAWYRVWSNDPWVVLAPDFRGVNRVKAGSSVSISIMADSQQLPVSKTATGTILVQTSVSAEIVEVPVNVRVQLIH